VLTHTAQIYDNSPACSRIYEGETVHGICDFVEALTNTFMNFLFPIWMHSSQNLRWPLIRMLLLITMSRQDLTMSVKFYWKV